MDAFAVCVYVACHHGAPCTNYLFFVACYIALYACIYRKNTSLKRNVEITLLIYKKQMLCTQRLQIFYKALILLSICFTRETALRQNKTGRKERRKPIAAVL